MDIIPYNPSNLIVDLMAFGSLMAASWFEVLDGITVDIAAVVVSNEGVVLRVRHAISSAGCLHLGVFLTKGRGYH